MSNSRKNILVVDDDPGILDVVKIILEENGPYDVTAMEDGNDAQNLETHKALPDLIILDVWLSGMNGADICRHLKSHKKTQDIPVILFSANRDIQTIAKKAGADDYIAKPFGMKDLLKKVREWV